MRKGLLRKQEKLMLTAIDRRLEELAQLAPEIRELLQIRSVLDALGPHIATLDALGPHIATLDALGPRIALIDRMSFNVDNFSKYLREIGTIENISTFADLVQQLRPIVENYLEQNHLISENVRVDVETVTVLITALEIQLHQLQKAIKTANEQ